MRLRDDIELLERAATIAGKAIWPDDDRCTVPEQTLRDLETMLKETRIAEYRLIGDEAVFLMIAARHVVIERSDDNRPMVERWTRLAELLRSAVAMDLVKARKSLVELER
jgi:hypothetical protein